jgi:AcrR family transcriptional regulator
MDRIACRLFAQRGFTRTRTRDIGEAFSIRAPSLYNHIGSKQEVLNRILLATFHDQYSHLVEALSLAETPVEKVRNGMRPRSASTRSAQVQ